MLMEVMVVLSHCLASGAKHENFTISCHHFTYLMNLLRTFKDFSFIIHCDLGSLEAANDILRAISADLQQFTTVYNSDVDNYPVLRRPYGIKFINVVLYEDPWKFEKFLLEYRNVILYDNVIFLLQDKDVSLENLSQFWKMRYIKFAGNVLIMNMLETNRTILHSKCYFCGYLAENLHLLEDTYSPSHKIFHTKLLPGKFDKFYGQHLLVYGLEFFPNMWCKQKATKIINNTTFFVCLDYSGSETHFVEIAAAKLNFTFAFVMEANNSFDRVMENLLARRVDFAIGGISVNYKRFLLATFTTNVRYENLVSLYVIVESKWFQFEVYLLPYTSIVWAMIVASILLISSCIWMFSKVSWTQDEEFYVQESLMICLKSILEQNVDVTTKRFTARVSFLLLLAALLFACIEIDSAYKSKIASFFVSPPYQELHTIEELLKDNYELVYNRMDFFQDILSPTDPIVLHAKEHGKKIYDLCERVDYLVRNRATIVGESAMLKLNMPFVCRKHLQPQSKTYSFEKLRVTSMPIRANPQAFIIQPAMPFWKAFDILIGKLHNAGLMYKWTNDEVWQYGRGLHIRRSSNNTRSTNDQHNMDIYMSSLVILGLGNAAAFLVFVFECVWIWVG